MHILRCAQKRGITRTLKAILKRRSAIEPLIEDMKMDVRLGRSPLKGAIGDALHAVLCDARHTKHLASTQEATASWHSHGVEDPALAGTDCACKTSPAASWLSEQRIVQDGLITDSIRDI